MYADLEFTENPLYESIIEQLMHKSYAKVDCFLSENEVTALRNNLFQLYQDEATTN